MGTIRVLADFELALNFQESCRRTFSTGSFLFQLGRCSCFYDGIHARWWFEQGFRRRSILVGRKGQTCNCWDCFGYWTFASSRYHSQRPQARKPCNRRKRPLETHRFRSFWNQDPKQTVKSHEYQERRRRCKQTASPKQKNRYCGCEIKCQDHWNSRLHSPWDYQWNFNQ